MCFAKINNFLGAHKKHLSGKERKGKKKKEKALSRYYKNVSPLFSSSSSSKLLCWLSRGAPCCLAVTPL